MSSPTGASLTILGDGKRRGRPRVEVPRASVATWLPAPDHDRVIAAAKARGESVSSYVRGLVVGATRPPSKP